MSSGGRRYRLKRVKPYLLLTVEFMLATTQT
jgi:hypothetical protein